MTDEELVKLYNPKASSLNPNHVKALRRVAAAALEEGAESMSDQVSEDFFGGRSSIKRQFVNQYLEDEDD